MLRLGADPEGRQGALWPRGRLPVAFPQGCRHNPAQCSPGSALASSPASRPSRWGVSCPTCRRWDLAEIYCLSVCTSAIPLPQAFWVRVLEPVRSISRSLYLPGQSYLPSPTPFSLAAVQQQTLGLVLFLPLWRSRSPMPWTICLCCPRPSPWAPHRRPGASQYQPDRAVPEPTHRLGQSQGEFSVHAQAPLSKVGLGCAFWSGAWRCRPLRAVAPQRAHASKVV